MRTNYRRSESYGYSTNPADPLDAKLTLIVDLPITTLPADGFAGFL